MNVCFDIDISLWTERTNHLTTPWLETTVLKDQNYTSVRCQLSAWQGVGHRVWTGSRGAPHSWSWPLTFLLFCSKRKDSTVTEMRVSHQTGLLFIWSPSDTLSDGWKSTMYLLLTQFDSAHPFSFIEDGWIYCFREMCHEWQDDGER